MKTISNITPLPQSRLWPAFLSNSLGLLLLLALARLLLHGLTNDQYGFHRDELATLDDARSLAWGYVAYPPLTPFLARLALELFGPSLVGLRLFSALAQSLAMVLAGLMARELGGSRPAQLLSAVAVAVAPLSLIQGSLFQYVSFDNLWWVLLAYQVIRLLKSEDPRWWLGIGAVIGQVTNRYGVENEETTDHPDIFVCRGLRRPWSEVWPQFRRFG
jgi:4-amino-4-deoxy-L-arabinose transferase-like glycosyltransferase